jgi:hypothetical protein
MEKPMTGLEQGQRRQVDNGNRRLVSFLLEAVAGGTLRRDDAQVLADWLEDEGDWRAAAVRELATAPVVVPLVRPPYKLFDEGLGQARTALETEFGAIPWAYPVACGSWWSVSLTPTELALSFYECRHFYPVLLAYGGLNAAARWPAVPIPPRPPSDGGDDFALEEALDAEQAAYLRLHAEALMARVLALLFAYDVKPLLACSGCGACKHCDYAAGFAARIAPAD